MYRIRKNGSTSNIERCRLLQDGSGANPGYGKTGLAFGTAGLVISTIADNEAVPTVYTQAGGTIEAITTLGTYAAPTATKCRFKEIDSANNPGDYEIQLADARYAVALAKTLRVTISGVAGMVPRSFVVQLTLGNDVGVEVDAYLSGQDPATLVLDVAAAGHNAAGSIGAKINASGSAGDPLTNLATAYTADQIGWRIAQTYSRLSAVSVTFVGPVAQASGLTTLIQGDDYKNVDGRALLFADAGGTWPNLTGGTVRLLSYPPGGSGLSLAGTILAAGTSTQQARFDLTAAQTSAAPLGGYPYHVTAVLASGDVVTLATGTLIVVQT